MSGEYRHQTITTTFLASPRRRDVVIAKIAADALTGAAMGVLSIVVTATIAVPWLLANGVDLDADGRAARVAVGLVVSTACTERWACRSVPWSATRPRLRRPCWSGCWQSKA